MITAGRRSPGCRSSGTCTAPVSRFPSDIKATSCCTACDPPWIRVVRTAKSDFSETMELLARADLVLRSGLEIAGAVSFVQLFFKRPAGAIDHSPALDGRAFADFFRPARQVFIFVRLQELARVVV